MNRWARVRRRRCVRRRRGSRRSRCFAATSATSSTRRRTRRMALCVACVRLARASTRGHSRMCCGTYALQVMHDLAYTTSLPCSTLPCSLPCLPRYPSTFHLPIYACVLLSMPSLSEYFSLLCRQAKGRGGHTAWHWCHPVGGGEEARAPCLDGEPRRLALLASQKRASSRGARCVHGLLLTLLYPYSHYLGHYLCIYIGNIHYLAIYIGNGQVMAITWPYT